jgi:hypothetical protein
VWGGYGVSFDRFFFSSFFFLSPGWLGLRFW